MPSVILCFYFHVQCLVSTRDWETKVKFFLLEIFKISIWIYVKELSDIAKSHYKGLLRLHYHLFRLVWFEEIEANVSIFGRTVGLRVILFQTFEFKYSWSHINRQNFLRTRDHVSFGIKLLKHFLTRALRFLVFISVLLILGWAIVCRLFLRWVIIIVISLIWRSWLFIKPKVIRIVTIKERLWLFRLLEIVFIGIVATILSLLIRLFLGVSILLLLLILRSIATRLLIAILSIIVVIIVIISGETSKTKGRDGFSKALK